MPFLDIATIIATALLSTALAVLWIVRGDAGPERIATASGLRDTPVSLLFENDTLHHASEEAAKLYQLTPGRDDWHSIREKLRNRFPGLPESPGDSTADTMTIAARHVEDTAALNLTRTGQFLRVSMLEYRRDDPEQTQHLRELETELENLRRAIETTPHAIWQVDAEHRVTWHNTAYATLFQKLHKSDPIRDKPLFETLSDLDGSSGRQRVSTQLSDDLHKDWYDVSAFSVGDITVFHAQDINAVVKSEIAQRNFVQTLAKTFAQLSIGLAIFDRNGQLALFNPALIDLTNLPADFLSRRPTLLSFFDRIRENRRMPEPKNYNSWRQQIAEVIAAATDGRYQETWTLETGHTYRVKGRPHPDGAIAFLIEDISAEVSLTRNFRAELELGQSLMDTFDDALAVFSSAGVLTFCNLAYRQMWGLDPDNSFADVTIGDSVKAWKSRCDPGARWAALTDFVLDFGEKLSWDMPVKMTAGAALTCTVSRIASGATIIRFTTVDSPASKKAKRVNASGSDRA